MSLLRLRNAAFSIALPVASFVSLAKASPLSRVRVTDNQQLSARSNVPNHPVSGISDFTPSSIAPYSVGDTNEDVAICLAIKDEYQT